MAGAIETIKAGDSIDTRVKKIMVFCLDCSNDQVCQISFPCTLPASCPWDDAPSKLDASGKFPAQVADFRALQVTNDAGFELDLQAASADLDDAQNILCEEFQIDIPDDIFEKVTTGELFFFFSITGMNLPSCCHAVDDRFPKGLIGSQFLGSLRLLEFCNIDSLTDYCCDDSARADRLHQSPRPSMIGRTKWLYTEAAKDGLGTRTPVARGMSESQFAKIASRAIDIIAFSKMGL